MPKKNPVLLLSGTPASGKDTVTKCLLRTSDRYAHFRKHKIDSGGKLDESYILVSKLEFDALAQNQEFIQYHYRYERGYGVSRKELERLWIDGKTPIVHVGKYENITPFAEASDISMISILILTSRRETEIRLNDRHGKNSAEIAARLQAYDEERMQLSQLIVSGAELNFDFIIENTKLPASETANLIQHFVEKHE